MYEEIAGHFSDTRHSPWPKVLDFVDAIPPGGLLIDVGCGNGKYMGRNSTIAKVSQLFPWGHSISTYAKNRPFMTPSPPMYAFSYAKAGPPPF